MLASPIVLVALKELHDTLTKKMTKETVQHCWNQCRINFDASNITSRTSEKYSLREDEKLYGLDLISETKIKWNGLDGQCFNILGAGRKIAETSLESRVN